MSSFLGVSAGVGIVAFGCYTCFTAPNNPEQQQQPKQTCKAIAFLVSTIAVLIYSVYGSSQPEQAHAHTNSCPISDLNRILSEVDDGPTTKMFRVFHNAYGISCNNYLPWNNNFLSPDYRIEGIRAEEMKENAMWGFDSDKRPFLTFKYTCEHKENKNEGVVTFYPRALLPSSSIVEGGAFKPAFCGGLGPLDPSQAPNFLADFHSFLIGRNVSYETWDKSKVVLRLS